MAAPRSISISLTLAAALAVGLLPGLAPAQIKAAKATAKSSVKSPAKKSAKKSATKKQTKAAARTATPSYRRSGQIKPTVERYSEIQQALRDRGYGDGTVDGKWGKSSEEALKQFQRDQNLKDDGKLGALSLMALGLGPKRPPATVAQTGPPPQVE